MTGGDQTIAVVDQSLLTHCAQFPQKYTKRPPKEKETKNDKFKLFWMLCQSGTYSLSIN